MRLIGTRADGLLHVQYFGCTVPSCDALRTVEHPQFDQPELFPEPEPTHK